MICIKTKVPKEICEINDELKRKKVTLDCGREGIRTPDPLGVNQVL